MPVFVSFRLQIHRETGATIYNSEKLGADYPYKAFDDVNSLKTGDAFNLDIENPQDLEKRSNRVGKMGYEKLLKSIFTLEDKHLVKSRNPDRTYFKTHRDKYTIVAVRKKKQRRRRQIF